MSENDKVDTKRLAKRLPLASPTSESTPARDGKLRRYSIHSIFRTIQGEGARSGRLAVFVRFTGCNIWSGNPEDRQRGSKKSACAVICDTEFRGRDEENGGGMYTAKKLVKKIRSVWGMSPSKGRGLVVLTGGEPSLQIDDGLYGVLTRELVYTRAFDVAVETNGTNKLPELAYSDWAITLSPKPPSKLVFPDAYYDELKVLYPFYSPLKYKNVRSRFRYVQPVDYGDERKNFVAIQQCLNFVELHPEWRISVQTHKILRVP